MHKKTHVWQLLAIYSLITFVSLGLTFTNYKAINASHYHTHTPKISWSSHKNGIHARNAYRIKINKKAHQKRLEQLRRRTIQHKRNVKRYRHIKRRHQINQRRFNQQRHKRRRQHNNKIHYNRDVVHNRNYGFYNNYKLDVDTVKPRNSYHEIMGNDKVSFKHPIYLNYNRYVHNHHHRYGDPQSMEILPNGTLYVLFNVGHKNSCINQIFKYNIKNHKLLKIGKDFKGGHGQGLSYNYKTKQLWTCINQYRHKGYPRGVLPKALTIIKINQKTLKPYGKHFNLHSHDLLGENFTYDNKGDYWNVVRSYKKHSHTTPLNSLQIYQGRKGKLRLIRDLLHSPSACIQNLDYNPSNNRLYVVGNGIIMSFPINHIRNLNNRNIKVAIMNHHSEFEDIGFWHHRAYLLVHPNRILISNKNF